MNLCRPHLSPLVERGEQHLANWCWRTYPAMLLNKCLACSLVHDKHSVRFSHPVNSCLLIPLKGNEKINPNIHLLPGSSQSLPRIRVFCQLNPVVSSPTGHLRPPKYKVSSHISFFCVEGPSPFLEPWGPLLFKIQPFPFFLLLLLTLIRKELPGSGSQCRWAGCLESPGNGHSPRFSLLLMRLTDKRVH